MTTTRLAIGFLEPGFVLEGLSIPPQIKEALDNHALYGEPSGSFVRAVLVNDLREAVTRADPGSLRAIRIIAIYVYNVLPGKCHGSAEAVDAWIEKGNQARREAVRQESTTSHKEE